MPVSTTSIQPGSESVTVANNKPGVVQLVHSHKAATQKAILMAFPLTFQYITPRGSHFKQ